MPRRARSSGGKDLSPYRRGRLATPRATFRRTQFARRTAPRALLGKGQPRLPVLEAHGGDFADGSSGVVPSGLIGRHRQPTKCFDCLRTSRALRSPSTAFSRSGSVVSASISSNSSLDHGRRATAWTRAVGGRRCTSSAAVYPTRLRACFLRQEVEGPPGQRRRRRETTALRG